MIKTNELRIGNLIIDPKDGQIKTVNAYQLNKSMIDDVTSAYLPIPLTAEILKKSGFVNGVLQLKNIGAITSANGGTDIAFTVNDVWTASRWFQSLHQLQNLYFALTGEELEVNIN